MTEYFWPFIGILVIAAGIGGLILQQGLLGTASEERIKRILGRLSVQTEHWEQELTDRIAQRKAKEAAAVPTLTNVYTRTDSLSAAHDLLTKGAITQAQYERLRDDIMK